MFGITLEPVFAAIFPPVLERVATLPCVGAMMLVVGVVMLLLVLT